MKRKRTIIQRVDHYVGGTYLVKRHEAPKPKKCRGKTFERSEWQVIWYICPDEDSEDQFSETILFTCKTKKVALALAKILEDEGISHETDYGEI